MRRIFLMLLNWSSVMRNSCLPVCVVVVLLLSVVGSLEADVIVESTHSGTIDGEPLLFESTAVSTDDDEGVSGSYIFPVPVGAVAIAQAEIPYLNHWAPLKVGTANWIIDHWFVRPEFSEFSLNLTIETTTNVSTGHTMTSRHAITESPTGATDVATFSVKSPITLPPHQDIVNPILITTTHQPGNPGQILIVTSFSSVGDTFATSTGIITLNENPTGGLSEPFSYKTFFYLFPVGDGTTGTFEVRDVDGPTSVKPQEKLTTTWATIKQKR